MARKDWHPPKKNGVFPGLVKTMGWRRAVLEATAGAIFPVVIQAFPPVLPLKIQAGMPATSREREPLTRSAAIHIAGNDPDESPFDIQVAGEGVK